MIPYPSGFSEGDYGFNFLRDIVRTASPISDQSELNNIKLSEQALPHAKKLFLQNILATSIKKSFFIVQTDDEIAKAIGNFYRIQPFEVIERKWKKMRSGIIKVISLYVL